MVGMALRPISHLTAWIVWHAARVSLLEDLAVLAAALQTTGAAAEAAGGSGVGAGGAA